MASIPINNLTNQTDINGAELLPFVRDGKTYRCSVSGLFYNDVITTNKIANGSVTPAKLSTAGPSWDSAGGTFTLSQRAVELGSGITADSTSFIDFHSSFPIIDNDARLIRASGTNGSFRILNNGTGNILLSCGTGNISLAASGNVGIGTTAPGAKLEVIGGSVDDATPEFRLSGSSGDISTYVSLSAGFYNPITLNQDKGIIFTQGSVNTGNLVIAPWSNSIGGIRINSSGNVGIKKSSPTTALDVDGTVTATGFSGPLTGTASNVSDGVITAAKLDGGQTGSAPIFGARAYGAFNGTATSPITPINAGNITSITRIATGVYTVEMTTAMSDANYCVVANEFHNVGLWGGTSCSITITNSSSFSISILNQAGAHYNPTRIDFVVFK